MLFSESFTCTNCGASIAEIQPRTFSFNSPHGACDRCDGLGSRLEIDPDLVVPNEDLSVNEGALVPWANSQTEYHASVLGALAEKYGIDLNVPWRELSEEHRNLILFGTNGDRIYVSYRNRYNRRRQYMTRFDGVVGNLQRRYVETDSEYRREKIEEFMSHVPCPKCKGARLRPEALAVTVGGKNVYEFTELSVTDAQRFFDDVEFTSREWIIGERVVKEIRERLGFLVDVGLGYLTLSRSAGTLSGGEAQRIRLASQVGSGLVGVLYVLDEPSIGLHQRDNRRLLTTLERLRDLGNTLIVVEHDEETIRAADYVIDVGPGAGVHGGEIIAAGSVEDIEAEERSVTGDFLSGRRRIEPPEERREPTGSIRLLGASEHNLKSVDVEFPLGVFTCITGVSGSGKSTLVNEILYKALANAVSRGKHRPGRHAGIRGVEDVDKVIDIDQSPIGRTPRSNPATYTKVFDHIRQLFASTPEAKIRGYKPGRFSFNVKGGRCEACRGDGQIRIEMHFLPDVYVPCEVCKGRRYNNETLRATYKGKSISDVLDMTVEEACEFFAPVPAISRRMDTLRDVGLGYVRLGPTGDHALGRRGPAGQAGERARQAGDGQDRLHPGRADDGAALRRRGEAALDPAQARGRREHGHRHRAQPRRHKVRGPRHRPRPRGRRRGRRDRRHGRPRRGRKRGAVAHGPLPARPHARGRSSGLERVATYGRFANRPSFELAVTSLFEAELASRSGTRGCRRRPRSARAGSARRSRTDRDLRRLSVLARTRSRCAARAWIWR